MNTTTKTYWFLLGSFPLISAAEITAVLKLGADEYAISLPFLATTHEIANPEALIRQLGGTIKIAEYRGMAESEDKLAEKIAQELKEVKGKVVYGLSAYFGETPRDTALWVKDIGNRIKNILKKNGLSARYVFNFEPILSSVTVAKNNLLGKGGEFVITKTGQRYSFARTAAVQPFEEWGARDFGRPNRDDFSGMLPPKLARMLINLASLPAKATILDPFCGSGTIATEAMALGYKKIIASDISEKAVADTTQNAQWLEKEFPASAKSEVRIFAADATTLSKKIRPESIDAIITEPYLGKPLRGGEPREELLAQADELKRLYLKAFGEFEKILKTNGTVVMTIPRFKHKNDWITISLADELASLNFRPNSLIKTGNRNYDFLLYARPDQKVGREIWIFRKTS